MNYVATDKGVFKITNRRCTAKIKDNKITLTCKVNTPDENWDYSYVTEWVETMENFSDIWGDYERKLNAHLHSIDHEKAFLEEGENRMDSIAARALRALIKEYKLSGAQAIADFNSRSILVSALKGF